MREFPYDSWNRVMNAEINGSYKQGTWCYKLLGCGVLFLVFM